MLLAITAAPVLRVLALTGVDHMIPNFTSLKEALAQTSANGNGGPPGAENSERKGLIAELGTRRTRRTSQLIARPGVRLARHAPAPGYLGLRADSRSAGVCSVKTRRVSAIRDRSLTIK